jgi:hypothetical protein
LLLRVVCAPLLRLNCFRGCCQAWTVFGLRNVAVVKSVKTLFSFSFCVSLKLVETNN